MTNKTSIAFNNAQKTYNSYCSAQLYAGKQLVDLLYHYATSTNVLVDIGCGTGISSKILRETVNHHHYVGIDFAFDLIAMAKNVNQYPNVLYLQADFDYPVLQPMCADCCFANMALQWSKNLCNTLHIFYQYLIPNGLLAFSIPLENSLSAIPVHSRNNFLTDNAILTLLKINRFHIVDRTIKKYSENFNNYKELIYAIKAIGANTMTDYQQSTSKVAPLLKLIRKNQPCALNYNLGFYLVQKT